jgi:uncharacterized protein Smg (DUF494 family)
MSSTHVLDIIVQLVQYLKQGHSIRDMDGIRKDLQPPFTEAELSAAYAWVMQHPQQEHARVPSPYQRIFHAAERMILTKEAWGWLIELQNLGIIDHHIIERIIEKIMLHYQGKIDLTSLKSMVSSLILDADPSSASQKPRLLGNESIN